MGVEFWLLKPKRKFTMFCRSAARFASSPLQTAFLGRRVSQSLYSSVANPPRVTLVEGDGIGPEIMGSVVGVFAAADVPIEWEYFRSGRVNERDLHEDDINIDELLVSLSRNGIALKGPLYTPIQGWSSRNMRIRKVLDLFANVVPIKNIPGIETRHDNVDFIVIRENTEGEYTGLEHEISYGIVQSLKVITHSASLRIADFAFNYAKTNNRKKVTAIHKANIQKLSDGEFLACCREVSKDYPDIEYNEMIIDNASMQMVMNPQQFDVVVTPNLYGAILQNIGSGLIGGPGILAGANYGKRGTALFELGVRHVGFDIANRNIADPIGGLLAGVMMLRHLDMNEYANRIESAVYNTIADTSNDRKRTRDLGGESTTREFTKAVIDRLA